MDFNYQVRPLKGGKNPKWIFTGSLRVERVIFNYPVLQLKGEEMQIKIITVGKIKEKYLKDAIEEYSKRLKKHCTVDIIEVPDEKTPDNASEKEELQIKVKEGQSILKCVADTDYVFALAIEGKMLTTEEFSRNVKTLGSKNTENIIFIIGGSLGLSKEVLNRSNYKLSFSKMTFPHQLMRVILLEQLSKSFISGSRFFD
jgi:23S rRNA (pseudouridine1915-N3)-methyltransferase